jgi:serine/threonine-protein kinase
MLCRTDPLAGVWDDERRADIERAFAATELTYATEASSRVRAGLDDWVARWTAVREQSCGSGRGEDHANTALALVCLADRRDDLIATVDLLARADADVVRAAPRLPEGLRAPEPCSDPRAHAEPPPPPDPGLVGRVQELRDELASVRALSRAGKYEPALAAVVDLRARADELGYGPLRAEVMNQHASMLDRLGRIDEAKRAMYEALWMATESRHREVVALTWVELVYVLGRVEQNFAEAHLAAEQARAEIAAIGGDAELESARLSNLGTTQYTEGRYQEALATFDQALALRDPVSHPLKRADVVYNIAVVELAIGRYEEAAAHTRECLAIWIEHAGPDHPETADLHHGLGMSFFQMRRFDEALVELERAKQLRESALGTKNPDYVTSLNGIGSVLLEMDRTDEAIEVFERGLAIEREVRGADHVDLHNELLNLAHAYAAAGRIDDAERVARRALALIERDYGPEHPNVSDAVAAVGAVQRARGDRKGAIASYERAIAVTLAISADLPGLGPLGAALGGVLLEDGRPDDAVKAIERGLSVYTGDPKIDPWAVAARWDLARARVAAGATRASVRADVERVLVDARTIGETELAATLEAWLAS